MIVTLNELKEHLYIDVEDVSENDYLSSLILVSEEAILNHCNRKSYVEFEEVPAALKHCVKLMCGTLYNNRETVTTDRIYKVPHAFEYLLQFYIKYY